MAMRRNVEIVASCYHCGDEVTDTPYVMEDHTFCCLGCQTVYQILNENNLQSYYTYNVHPGKAQKSSQADLSYLDEPNIIAKLVDYQDTEIGVITFYIPVIHCSSCVWLLEHLYKLNPAIASSQVDFMKKQTSITFKNQEISLRELVQLLVNIGYEPKITLQDVVKEGKKINQGALVRKITVAGFCFGNSMMISFPDYFGMGVFEREYASFFGYMNLAFGIPVLLYSASDYFTSAWYSLKQRRLNLDVPLALGILVLFLRSAFDILNQSGAGFIDTLCSLVFFILIGKWVQQRTYYHISFERDYRSYFPVAVTVIQDHDERPIQIAELQVGDRILVRNNEIIPADAILLNGYAAVDFSFVTGESKPIEKTLGELVYAGGRQIGGAIELEVVKPVSQSYLTRLWNNESFKSYDKNFDTFVGLISKYFTVALISIAMLAALLWAFGGNADRAWGAFTAVLIIACPCALALSSPFTLSAALSIFDKNKLYIKNTSAIEQMAAIDTIVFDKTGTISSPTSSAMYFEGELTKMERQIVSSICRNSSHPLSREIVKWLAEDFIVPIERYAETVGMGQEGIYQDYVVRIGSAGFVNQSRMTVGGSVVYVSVNDNIKGFFTLEQSWRTGLSDVINELKKNSYHLHLISGDNERRADTLRLIFPEQTKLLFNQTPSDKMTRIEAWQHEGKRVCMLGDGLNDAGALRTANLGIAVSDDINNFSPGCDAILDGVSFDKLPRFFAFAGDAVKVIKISFVISMLYNVVGLSFAVQGTMSPLFAAILMPISTVTIISFTSLMTRWYANRRKLI
ncbi:HAD family hydrolase [Sphingobacterium alkalisoli]|uniref:HAD family hydrolase n=2 Tax=Sphingobacterium alkalisoli TaxID=1874115 RepID=A0A4V5LXH8_9SPHI|nr:heavy metal translocating P-type ATPase metal-binding domain-containing protein [Sphingobacterium alkalisoli]TJY62399.1 HAD family hydrolase [Sphingobacterium alkalisoli]